ncbi:hypothetical protein ACFO4N_17885 [Camelliibacillus cellulosilyticus]|uniref:Uncharacterized protein n=1 Tax=Camelliibacillus cellulosilyticus TaxID=2174486 RepID=A0ABV9GTF1_9BACL
MTGFDTENFTSQGFFPYGFSADLSAIRTTVNIRSQGLAVTSNKIGDAGSKAIANSRLAHQHFYINTTIAFISNPMRLTAIIWTSSYITRLKLGNVIKIERKIAKESIILWLTETAWHNPLP